MKLTGKLVVTRSLGIIGACSSPGARRVEAWYRPATAVNAAFKVFGNELMTYLAPANPLSLQVTFGPGTPRGRAMQRVKPEPEHLERMSVDGDSSCRPVSMLSSSRPLDQAMNRDAIRQGIRRRGGAEALRPLAIWNRGVQCHR
jgi:hypothetical protein